MNVHIKRILKYSSFSIFLAVGACASKKSGKKVSFMKNLTAHYNIYYNASEMLKTSELNFKNANKDDYNNLLVIFPIPTKESSEAESENLNEVILRANRIALEKYESNWIDDAFLLLAKAEYYKGNFFNAAEYFSYVSQNFPNEKKNTVEALVWHGKALFALKKHQQADSILQLAYSKNQKAHRAELNAALAQSYLYQNKLTDAEFHLTKSVNFAKDRYSKIRWTYILAQIQEETGKLEAAYSNYGKVVRSNASFEMSFNANLAQVRLKESASGIQFDKIATLHRLLKEDKNKEFKDQIYYQIGQSYEDLSNLDDAIKYYNISAHTEPGSAKQKALSYLRLAELNFDSLKNYSNAQLYYDSTLQNLPKEYPSFNAISLKAKNLQYLADRLIIIEKENELLMLSNLSEEERLNYIDKKIKEIQTQKEEEENVSAQASNNLALNLSNANTNIEKGNSEAFYFNNSTAISQGINEFKKRWGNRKLADNWRVSAGVANTSLDQNPNLVNPLQQLSTVKTGSSNLDSLRNSMLSTIPTTPEQKGLALSKIRNARYEIAMFYKDKLNDNEAAIEELEQLLKEYTLNDLKVPELYYQLYRLYEEIDLSKSEQYRNLIIKHFPESVYAKALINPDFGKEKEAVLARLNKLYEDAYLSYTNKKYAEAITKINGLEAQTEEYPSEAAKFAYLKALAIGHTEKAPAFVSSLEEILKRYPNDTTVNAQIQNQLTYIANNRALFYNRPTALLNYDPNEIIPITNTISDKPNVTLELSKEITSSQPSAKNIEITKGETSKTTTEAPKDILKSADNTLIVETDKMVKEPEKTKVINFSNNIRIKHAVVVDIKNATMNVAKPFAALTKHFYTTFAPGSVNLSIRTIGNTDKLIIVKGPFTNKDMAEKALTELSGSLSEMLGLKENEFTSFVISDPNLLLINSTESLNQYLNFIK